MSELTEIALTSTPFIGLLMVYQFVRHDINTISKEIKHINGKIEAIQSEVYNMKSQVKFLNKQ